MESKKLDIVAGRLFSREGCPSMTGSGQRDGLMVAGQKAVIGVLEDLISVLFPGCYLTHAVGGGDLAVRARTVLGATAMVLQDQVRMAFEYACTVDTCKPACRTCEERAGDVVNGFVEKLPQILCVLQEDVQAAYEGDPAAKSMMEVVLSYPGVYAVMVHRIAHELYQSGVPLIPRMMSEHAHSRTGIDIHPGAQIGSGFFIDHGTGVVIGETCVIGKRVKLYQGVTLGALSFEKDAQGRLVKGVKRHPDVEDNVVVYAGATILGGRTRIGQGAVIGGNVWLTHSVPPGAKVYNQQPNPLIREVDGSWKTSEGPWQSAGDGI
ncbi:MAG: serine O-acetyltransferase EpsC [Kiritimatiellia bacterium]